MLCVFDFAMDTRSDPFDAYISESRSFDTLKAGPFAEDRATNHNPGLFGFRKFFGLNS
jgi:hypothetical protein